MTIYFGSRYEDDVVERVSVGDHFEPTVFHTPRPLRQFFNYSIYTTEYGTRLDALAAQFYNDPELGWVIANANPDVFYPDDIPLGTVLRIPDSRVLG